LAFSLKDLLRGAGTVADAIIPGDQSSWHQPTKSRPASTAQPNLIQQAGNAIASTARNVASTRIPSLGVSLNEIGAQLPGAANTAISNTPLLGEAYKFGQRAASPQFQQQSLPQQVGQFAQSIGKTGYDWTLGGLERTGGRIAATATGQPQQSFSGTNLPVQQEIGQAAPIAGNKLLGQAVAGLGIAGDALSLPAVVAGPKVVAQGAKDVAKAAQNANKALGEKGFISVSAPIIDKPLNPALAPEAKVAVSEAQNTIEQLHQQIAVAQDSINYAKEHVATLNIPQAQKDKALATFVADANAKVAAAKQEMGGWLEHIDQLDPSGQSRPIKTEFPSGVPQGQTTLLQQQAAADAPKPTIAQKISTSFKQAVGNERGSVDFNAPIVGSKLPTKSEEVAAEKLKIAPQSLNTNNLKISEDAKGEVNALSQADPVTHMSDKQVQDLAKNAGVDLKSHTIDQTRQKVAEQYNLRQKVVTLSNQADQLLADGKIGERAQLLQKIQALAKTTTEQGTDIARQLSARRILANELDTPMQRVFKLLDKDGVNPEVYIKKFAKVDFNDSNAVVKAYRELVPPSKSNWLDTIRYNSMLSSPLTQINNIFPNIGSTAVITPIEKTLTGMLDAAHSALTGKPRQFATGEGAAYAKGYFSSFGEAKRRFSESMSGKAEAQNLDMRGHVPMYAHGQNKAYDVLSYPMRLMEAMDGFFTGLTEGGVTKALEHRQAKGITAPNIANTASAESAYRLYRQELGDKSQGTFLQALDIPAQKLMELRNSKNPVVSYPAKFTVPFVRTTMNIFKQGFEYSPAGVLTMHGSANKTEQLSKMILGTTVVGAAGALLGKDLMTWAQPTNPKQLEAWKAAGIQPYSVKIGKNWVSFQKLPPALSFNLALVSALDDAQKNAKINQNGIDNVLTALAKYGQFLSDQSYTKSAGNFLKAVQGDGQAFTQLVSGYPQQLIPFRALSNWLANMTDDKQRKINKDASFAAQQLEALMQVIPGLRQNTTTVKDPNGQDVPAQHPYLNAVSPAKISTEDAINADYYRQLKQQALDNSNAAITKKQQAANGSGKLSGSKTLNASAARVKTASEKLPKGISQSSANVLKQYAALSTEGKNKFNADEANKLKLHQAQYEQDKLSGKLTNAKDFAAQNKLAKEAITSKYPQEIQDFYALSKSKQNAYFASNRPKAKELYDQAKKLDSELNAGKFTTTPKYKYGLGKKPKSSKYAKGGKLNYSKQLVSGKTNSTALRSILSRVKIKRKSIKVAKAKVSNA